MFPGLERVNIIDNNHRNIPAESLSQTASSGMCEECIREARKQLKRMHLERQWIQDSNAADTLP